MLVGHRVALFDHPVVFNVIKTVRCYAIVDLGIFLILFFAEVVYTVIHTVDKSGYGSECLYIKIGSTVGGILNQSIAEKRVGPIISAGT